MQEEFSLIQLLGQNVTPRFWSDVKADKERKLLPCSEHEKGLIVFTSQVLEHQHHGKKPQWEHRISSEVKGGLAARSFLSLSTCSLVSGNEVC